MALQHINGVPNVPAAIGPYSQAVRAGGLIFLSGVIPLDPTTGTLVSGGIEEQATQVMKNCEALLTGLTLRFDMVAKTTIFLTDLGDFAKVNEIYGSFLGDSKPARSTIEVKGLPRGARIEVEMIAVEQ